MKNHVAREKIKRNLLIELLLSSLGSFVRFVQFIVVCLPVVSFPIYVQREKNNSKGFKAELSL